MNNKKLLFMSEQKRKGNIIEEIHKQLIKVHFKLIHQPTFVNNALVRISLPQSTPQKHRPRKFPPSAFDTPPPACTSHTFGSRALSLNNVLGAPDLPILLPSTTPSHPRPEDTPAAAAARGAHTHLPQIYMCAAASSGSA